jgi:hypothetical protein
MKIIIPHINNGEELNIIPETLGIKDFNVVFLSADGKKIGVTLKIPLEEFNFQNELISALNAKYGISK